MSVKIETPLPFLRLFVQLLQLMINYSYYLKYTMTVITVRSVTRKKSE